MKADENFTANLSEDIWNIVGDLAKKKGYSSPRKYIHALASKVGTIRLEQLTCQGERKNKQRIFKRPPHCKKELALISCKLGLPLSTIMTMVIFSEVLSHLSEEAGGAEG